MESEIAMQRSCRMSASGLERWLCLAARTALLHACGGATAAPPQAGAPVTEKATPATAEGVVNALAGDRPLPLRGLGRGRRTGGQRRDGVAGQRAQHHDRCARSPSFCRRGRRRLHRDPLSGGPPLHALHSADQCRQRRCRSAELRGRVDRQRLDDSPGAGLRSHHAGRCKCAPRIPRRACPT